MTWTGDTPEHLLDGMAHLRARMTTDAPNGSREAEEAAWDAARIRREEEVSRSARRTRLWAVALGPAGEPVGYTMLESPDGQPEVAHQMDTLVRCEDRGHGLGRVLYADMISFAEVRVPVLGCQVSLEPRDNASLMFHASLGFKEVAQLQVAEGRIGVMERQLCSFPYIRDTWLAGGRDLPDLPWLADRALPDPQWPRQRVGCG